MYQDFLPHFQSLPNEFNDGMDLPLEKDVVFQIAGVVEWYFEVLRRVAVGDVPDFTSTVDHRLLGRRDIPHRRRSQCKGLAGFPSLRVDGCGVRHIPCFRLAGRELVEATSHDGDSSACNKPFPIWNLSSHRLLSVLRSLLRSEA